MNNVQLLGRLTTDPEVNYTQSEKPVAIARFTLAVNRPYSKDNKADFLRCIAFNKTAEVIANYLHKGNRLLVNGSIQTDSYTGKDGNKVYTTDILVNQVELIEKKQEPDMETNDKFINSPNSEELPFN